MQNDFFSFGFSIELDNLEIESEVEHKIFYKDVSFYLHVSHIELDLYNAKIFTKSSISSRNAVYSSAEKANRNQLLLWWEQFVRSDIRNLDPEVNLRNSN
ncbi:hypothetical protein H8D57_03415 [bacterium]|nr:hypothetical protein [bacterium]